MCLRLLSACKDQGHTIMVVSTLRTLEEQAADYAKGRDRAGPIVTYAKPGYSWHNFGRAFDVAFEPSPGKVSWFGDWNTVGHIGESLGLRWGGRWLAPKTDRPHFENPGTYTLAQLRAAA